MDARTLLVIAHIIGTTLGAGAATVSDYLFFKFTKDGKLDKDEYRILVTVSDIVWFGLLILLVSALGFLILYLSGDIAVQRSYNLEKIWAKFTIVAILLMNGFFMHRVVLPMLHHRESRSLITPSFIKRSPIMFTAGAISAVSWYSAIIIGGWRGAFTLSYIQVLGIYAAIIILAIVISNTVGRIMIMQLVRQHKRKKR